MPLSPPLTSIFPFYLLPSIPFRRQSDIFTAGTLASSRSSIDATTSSPLDSPGYLTKSQALLRCSRCLAHICPTQSIISKGFTGRHGRAYLVAPPSSSSGFATPPVSLPRHQSLGNLPNTHTHKPVPRQLVTGAHTVSDISCTVCGSVLGWKYVSAEEESQTYKVGMFILETKRIIQTVDWETDGYVKFPEDSSGKDGGPPSLDKRKDSGVDVGTIAGEGGHTEFDSQDEDECEDLFMGIWSPSLARKRRRTKVWSDERD
jgi:hypothetical protein